ncbi:MAG: hypothetical protein OEQ74_03085 [Gammaproteobacteria bacterium]|nr:hypothetical protein [Gammaproteobacteria bacterium]
MRKFITLTIAVALFAVGSVNAGSSKVAVYKFMFDGQNGPVELELNSETMGFGLHDLAPGDVRTTVTEDGTSVTVSRLEDTISLAVGEDLFEIPARHGPGHMAGGHKMMLHEGGRAHAMIAQHHGMTDDGLMIISKNPLDETTQATIRDAISAAGIIREVNFLSPGLAGENVILEENIDEETGHRMIIKRIVEE